MPIRFAGSSSLVLLALAGVAMAQDSAAVIAHIDAAQTMAGPEWARAATFFCSTEEQVAAMKILPSATSGDVDGQRAEPMKVWFHRTERRYCWNSDAGKRLCGLRMLPPKPVVAQRSVLDNVIAWT